MGLPPLRSRLVRHPARNPHLPDRLHRLNPEGAPPVNEPVITITGNLTADPELRFTPTGQAAVSFTIASTPRFKDASGEWKDGETWFVRCTAWRDLGSNVAECLTRGTAVVATG